MTEYYSVKEASELLGLSQKVIHRFIRKILMNNEENVSKNIRLSKHQSGFNYIIEKNFLLDQFQRMKESGDESIYSSEYTETLPQPASVLAKAAVKQKDHEVYSAAGQDIVTSLLGQLQQKDILVTELLHRIKELNELVKGLQHKLILLETDQIRGEKTPGRGKKSKAQNPTRILDDKTDREH